MCSHIPKYFSLGYPGWSDDGLHPIRSSKKNVTGKKSGGGFIKICSLSPQLQKFTGEAELARTEVHKFLMLLSLFLFWKPARHWYYHAQLKPFICLTKVVKKMWNYIRENSLQDPANRWNINCDDTLRELFGVDKMDIFQMNKALAEHIWPLDSDGGNVNSSLLRP